MNKCKYCGKILKTIQAIACISCHSKLRTGIKNANYKHGKTLQKSYCIDCGKLLSIHAYYYNHKRCKKCAYKYKKTSKKFKGKNNPNWKKHLKKETINKIRNSKYHQNLKGKNNPMWGKKAKHGKRFWYKNICFRSTWELLYAKYLEKNKIKWQYEPKRFYLGDITYTPDFYLPKTNEYIEIKGYWRDNTKRRFNKFKEKYPNIKIKLLMELELKNMGIL